MKRTPYVILLMALLPVVALSTEGPIPAQAERGKALFLKSTKGIACGTCHALGTIGTAVGPDLTKLASFASPKVLTMAIEMTMTAYVQQVESKQGNFVGIQKQKVGDQLEIWDLSKMPPELRAMPASDVRSMKGNEHWKHPPTSAHYTNQELADIISFLKYSANGYQKEETPDELGKK